MKIKILKNITIAVILAVSLFALASCGTEYTVSFDTDGSGEIEAQIIREGELIQKPQKPKKDGYSFDGWFLGDKEWDFAVDTVMGNINLKAKYTPIEYTVRYESGDSSVELAVFTVNDLPLELPSKTFLNEEGNALFAGWYLDEELKNSVTEITETGDLKLYPKWNVGTDGLKYRVTSTGAVSVTGYEGTASEVIIPEGVSSIADKAFWSNTDITSITLPTTISRIYSDAFGYCVSLKSVYISEMKAFLKTVFGTAMSNPLNCGADLYLNAELVSSVTVPAEITELKAYTFYGCTSLVSIELPETMTLIGNGAFANCTVLTDIKMPKELDTIGDFTFSDCYSLSCFDMPKGVTYIGTDAFLNCIGLNAVYTLELSEWFKIKFAGIESNPLYRAGNLYLGENAVTSISVPAGTAEIYNYTFAGFNTLTALTLPEGLLSIGDYAFSGCTLLTGVSIPNGTEKIGKKAFYECSTLASLSLPASLSEIGESAFAYCASLEALSLPAGLTLLGDFAFTDCKKLGGEITVPDGVKRIGKFAFAYCTALESVTLPDGLTEIGGGAFLSCKKLASIKIPDTVTVIDNAAFASCTALESVELSSALEDIGYFAFSGCENLKSVKIPITVQTIDFCAFRGCSALEIKAKAESAPDGWDSTWNADSRPVKWGYRA